MERKQKRVLIPSPNTTVSLLWQPSSQASNPLPRQQPSRVIPTSHRCLLKRIQNMSTKHVFVFVLILLNDWLYVLDFVYKEVKELRTLQYTTQMTCGSIQCTLLD